MRGLRILLALLGLLAAPALAQVPISALPAASTPLAGTELVPIVQGGVTKQVASSNLANWPVPGTIGSTTPNSGAFTTLSSTSGAINASIGATTPNVGDFTNETISGTLTYGGVTAASSVTGTGSVVLSNSPTLTGTTTTAGLNGTAIAASTSLLSTGQGGVGYSAGAGGTVTQLTSRTTGVLLNAITGQITLFSAAGTTSPASFTVTDSSVGANDVIEVVQKSGSNLYEIFVTAVSAGSFQVTQFTTGGTATEAPVFSFAVIKASPS